MSVMQLTIAYYQLLPSFYWQWFYQRVVKKDAKISIEDFRDLYIINRAFAAVEQIKEWQRQIVFAPLHLLNPLSDLLQSRWLEDRRLTYARYINLFLYRQYLNHHNRTKKGANIIRVVGYEYHAPIIFLTLYHVLADRTNMPRYAKIALHEYFHIPQEGVRTKRLDKHHLQVIFSRE